MKSLISDLEYKDHIKKMNVNRFQINILSTSSLLTYLYFQLSNYCNFNWFKLDKHVKSLLFIYSLTETRPISSKPAVCGSGQKRERQDDTRSAPLGECSSDVIIRLITGCFLQVRD